MSPEQQSATIIALHDAVNKIEATLNDGMKAMIAEHRIELKQIKGEVGRNDWLCRPRCIDGSVACARRASLAAASIEPSACSTIRPDARAFCTAPREMPVCAAYSRSLIPTRPR